MPFYFVKSDALKQLEGIMLHSMQKFLDLMVIADSTGKDKLKQLANDKKFRYLMNLQNEWSKKVFLVAALFRLDSSLMFSFDSGNEIFPAPVSFSTPFS